MAEELVLTPASWAEGFDPEGRQKFEYKVGFFRCQAFHPTPALPRRPHAVTLASRPAQLIP